MALELDSLPIDWALLSEYVPPYNVFTECQYDIDRVARITNRDIKECPVRDGGSLWVITGIPVREGVGMDKVKTLMSGMEGDSLRDVDSIAGR